MANKEPLSIPHPALAKEWLHNLINSLFINTILAKV
jgi:hypothetical protein